MEAIQRTQDLGIRMYEQNPMLKGINDNVELLVMQYDRLRELGIDAHYLFHAIPAKGTAHFRTSLERYLQIGHELK